MGHSDIEAQAKKWKKQHAVGQPLTVCTCNVSVKSDRHFFCVRPAMTPVAPCPPPNNSKWAVKVAIEPLTLGLGWSGLITNYSSSAAAAAAAPGPIPSVICVSALTHLSVRLVPFLTRRSRAVISGQRQPVIKPVISSACQLTS